MSRLRCNRPGEGSRMRWLAKVVLERLVRDLSGLFEGNFSPDNGRSTGSSAGISFDIVGLTEVGPVFNSGGRRELFTPLGYLCPRRNFTLRYPEARELSSLLTRRSQSVAASVSFPYSIPGTSPFALLKVTPNNDRMFDCPADHPLPLVQH
jgi:hypothetical protein